MEKDEEEKKNAHKHPAHYAKAPAAGNTSQTGWQEGEERNSGGDGGGDGGGIMVGWTGLEGGVW